MDGLKRIVLFPKEYDGKELTLDLTLVTRWSWGTKSICEDLNHHIFTQDESVQAGDFIYSSATVKEESDDLTNEFVVLVVTNNNENAINTIISNNITKGRSIKVKAKIKVSIPKNLIVYLIVEDIVEVIEKPKKKSAQDEINDMMLDLFGLGPSSENDE